MVRILSPKSEESVLVKNVTSRIATLEGKVVGLLENRKLHADTFMEELETILLKEYKADKVIYRKKRAYSEACDQVTMQDLIDNTDVIIHAISD
ncbi:MAG TPA: hypothetical protein DEZ08_00365 [Dehalococcoidia bacterium]|jgi:hypothetical protein|nr:hypothetical protein [Dehalococcoidia bacterium]|tara:strand:- start:191 stop:472 length:282 start_codon:yes stop_codon:yes gene_type:complete